MTTNRRRWAARTVAVALAAGVLGVAGAGTSLAVEDVTTSRIAGTDRFATAAAVAAAAYPSGADTVLVASGRSFPDALAGAALASRQGAPVLLTEPSALPAATSKAVDDLKATKAVILGGTTAVTKAVEDELAKKVTVSRVAGQDRYDTAAKIAAAIGSANIGSSSGRRTALIATGAKFADALAGGALSAAGSGGVLPVLLVDSGVPAATRTALTDLGIKQTIILGGTSAVSATVASELHQITGNSPTRLAGNDRFATATAIATSELTDFGFAKTGVLLANGIDFADALAGGPLGGKDKQPILLTEPTTLSRPTRTYLADHEADIATIRALGGTAAVSDPTLAAAKSAAQGDTSPPAGITVEPSDQAFQPNNGSGTRTYTASGVTGQVDIALVLCDSVEGGTFDNSNKNSIADGGASGGAAPDQASTPASISQVNGAPNLGSNNDYADDASASDGKVTFVVSGPNSGTTCVVPVVFADANSDDALNTSAGDPATPSEAFGVGGPTEFVPDEAGSGSFSNLKVQTASADSDRFVACTQVQQCSTFFYDSGDDFQVDGPSTTMANFEKALSADDTVSGTYTPGGKSTFSLADAGPAAPSPLNAQEVDAVTHDVQLTFTDSSTSGVDSYKVYRGLGEDNDSTPLPGDVDCTSATYLFLTGATVADDGSSPTHQYTDTTTDSGKFYCYKLSSVDGIDEGPLSTQAAGVATS